MYKRQLNSLPDSANVIDVTLKRNNHITNIKTLKSKLEEVNSTDSISGFATLTYIDPVSYTHLDVYKRQIQLYLQLKILFY